MKTIDYKASGVNIDEGNRAVALMKEVVKTTYDEHVVGDLGLFSGAYELSDANLDQPVLLAATDGVGTKLMIAQSMGIHDSAGIDLVAMSVNDLICQGAKPLFFLDYIACGKTDANRIAKIVSGIAAGCRQAGCALIGGETAEMPGMYQSEEYDLAGFAVGIAEKSKIIRGQDVKAGDVLLGISSSGLHSNGYSLARKLFFEELRYGVDTIMPDGKTLGELLLEPTRIYVKVATALMEEVHCKAIAHITGGGLMENVTRVIPEGLGIQVETEKIPLPDIFTYIKNTGLVDRTELYRTFNMGVGLVVVLDSEDVQKALNIANRYYPSFVIGEVTASPGVRL